MDRTQPPRQTKYRTVLHLDLDAFFCAVEILRDPALKGIPFAVGGKPDQRGVVASCSYEARAFGIRSAMPMSQAVRLCPHLVIVSSNFGAYRSYSSKVMGHLNKMTPFVQQISIDEAFMDVTGLAGNGESIARRLQSEIREQFGLPSSLGVASNKLVAKIANNIGKAQARVTVKGTPNAITVVPPGREAAYLAPLSIEELWGVGPKTAEKLRRMNITTIGDLAQCQPRDLHSWFGKNGLDLLERARGEDPRPVEAETEAKSISKEITFTRDQSDRELLQRTLRQLAEGVGRNLRQDGIAGTTVKLKIRWSNFETLTRQMSLAQPVDQDEEIYRSAVSLFNQVWPPGKPVRLIGVGVTNLDTAYRQLGLWDVQESEQSQRWQRTLDDLRERFGSEAIRRGSDYDSSEEL
jgi:DNA polymerase IV